MDELGRKALVLGARLGPRWSPQHVEACLVRLHATVRTRSRRRLLASAGLGIAWIGAMAVFFWPSGKPISIPRALHARPDRPHERQLAVNTALELEDGSRIVALQDRTDVITAQPSRRRVHIRLRSGSARFEVKSNARRRFQVDADGVHIEVIGTSFTVAHDPSGVRVRVFRGKVRVQWAGAHRLLVAGDEALFPERHVTREAVPEPAGAGEEEPTPAPEEGGRKPVEERADAKVPRMDDVLDRLLAAADVARLSERPEEAVDLLRRALALGLPPSREAIAAFTMGRVLLDELRDAGDAAEAFARARAALPAGPLAEDALAREVEAWAKARATDVARERAQEYVERYPNGRRTRLVHKYGRLD